MSLSTRQQTILVGSILLLALGIYLVKQVLDYFQAHMNIIAWIVVGIAVLVLLFFILAAFHKSRRPAIENRTMIRESESRVRAIELEAQRSNQIALDETQVKLVEAHARYLDAQRIAENDALMRELVRDAARRGQTVKFGQGQMHIEAPLRIEPPAQEQSMPVTQVIEDHTPDEDRMHISPGFNPHADDILSGRISIVGVSGSGKGNTTAVLTEELGRLGVPLVLADTENEYESLCDSRYLPRFFKAGADEVDASNAYAFAQWIMKAGRQVILNLNSYETEPDAALTMAGILEGLRDWEDQYQSDDRVPCTFFLSEAHVWLPQNMKESLLPAEVKARLENIFFTNLVRRGRKRGLGLVFDTQRYAEVDKRLLQSNTKILHRQTEKTDLEGYGQMGLDKNDVLSLMDGECFIFSGSVSKLRTRIRLRHSPHGAKTPGLEAVRRHQYRLTSALWTPERPAEISGQTSVSENDFGREQKPFRVISGTVANPQKSAQNSPTVPAEIRNNILRLAAQGYKRTDIQAELGLNGDQYWMIRETLNNQEKEG